MNPRPLLAALCLAAACAAQASPEFDRAAAAWHDSRFREAYDGLAWVREQPNGRRPVVDFMLGTSGCRLGDAERDYGLKLLDWMLYAYPLSHESRRLVRVEQQVCAQGAQGVRVAARPGDIEVAYAAGMSGFGKVFHWAGQDQPVSAYPMRRVANIPLEEFTRRLVPLGEETRALALARELAPRGRPRVHGPFLIIGNDQHAPADLERVGRTLERFLGFLVNEYGMVAPGHYLRVHLLRDTYQVSEFANRVHGLDVSRATVGYAFVEDAAVVGFVQKDAVGTILHELFHMLVRSNFGDIPQWLDEGVASLYEVSGRRGDRYYGQDNWRRKALDSVWRLRPSLRELIRSEWFLYDDPRHVTAFETMNDGGSYHDQGAGRRQAAMMAVARYFAMYLEQRGELTTVYRAVRDRGLVELEGDARDHAVALVERTLGGRSIEEVDAAFVRWYQENAKNERKPLPDGGRPYVATGNSVNVRTGPGKDHESLMRIDAGTPVGVHGEEAGWMRVKLSDGTEAWISADYLAPAR